MINIVDFLDLCIFCNYIEIYDLKTDSVVFTGDAADIIYTRFQDAEVESFEVENGTLTINTTLN